MRIEEVTHSKSFMKSVYNTPYQLNMGIVLENVGYQQRAEKRSEQRTNQGRANMALATSVVPWPWIESRTYISRLAHSHLSKTPLPMEMIQ